VSDNIIKTRDQHYIGIIRLGGFSFQTADNRTLNTLLEQRNSFIRALSNSRWQLYSHIIRKRIVPELAGTFHSPFSHYLNERYQESLNERALYVNELYLSVVRKPSSGKMGMIESVANLLASSNDPETAAEMEAERIADLNEALGRFNQQLTPYGSKILSVQMRDGSFYSEPCAFLYQLINGPSNVNIRLPRMGLADYLPAYRPLFQKRLFVLQGPSVETSWFGAMVSIKEYPAWVAAGILDRLLRLPREFILTQSFSVHERDEARGRIEKQTGQLEAGDDGDSSVVDKMEEARDRLMSGITTFGDHHLTVNCLARTIKEVEKSVEEVTTSLSEVGIIPVREDINMEPAFWAQLPGNSSYIARKAMISSLDVMALSSFHNYPSGEKTNLRWKTPITLFETNSHTPYHFSFHQVGDKRAAGNFLIIGPTGTGKTVLQAFLIAQIERVTPSPNLFYFDKDRGGEIMIRALGGHYESLRLGHPTGFNPLQLENSPKTRAFLAQLFEYLCLEQGQERLPAIELEILQQAINTIMDYLPYHRTMGNFHELLQGHHVKRAGDLASRFKEWVDVERRGWLFNNEQDRFVANARIVGFDMTELLITKRELTAASMYIFHRSEAKLREEGPPTAFSFDEGWAYLKDAYFSDYILDKIKTIRKLNGIIGLSTQTGQDVKKSHVGSELIQQTQTKIFYPNSEADEQIHRVDFKLSAREYDWILKTPREERSFLIKHGLDSVVAKLDLKDMPEILSVLSSDKDSLAEMDALREKVGDDPSLWLPLFMTGES